MITLILGGSCSGKSAYAERYITEISGDSQKYYLAAMQASDTDRETQVRIERHRMMRRGKGFLTIEQPVSISGALGKMETGTLGFPKEKTALLECISNLTANEMFLEPIPKPHEAVTDKIVREIGLLNGELKHLVIVSNNVFEDGVAYDEDTMEYIKALGSINEKLAVMAGRVVEVVAGIPLLMQYWKEDSLI